MIARRIASVIGAVVISTSSVVILQGTAAADPSCGYLITPVSTNNGSKVYTETPKCGQKVRAVANCLALGGAAKVYGNILSSAGYSTATCGSTTEVTQRGYQKQVGGSWGSITWYPKP